MKNPKVILAAPASSNVKGMNKRLKLMRFIIEKHINSYRKHITDALLGIEEILIRDYIYVRMKLFIQ